MLSDFPYRPGMRIEIIRGIDGDGYRRNSTNMTGTICTVVSTSKCECGCSGVDSLFVDSENPPRRFWISVEYVKACTLCMFKENNNA
jgi:hypothetical protein